MKYCMECGTELPQRANFCSNCGLQLTDQTAVTWEDEDDQQPEHVPELHTPPVPAPPIEPAFAPPIGAPMPEREPEPPVPVVPHAFREPYIPESEREPGAEAPITYSSALPWETEERTDLVPPPASAYADEPPLDLEPPPAPGPGPVPRFESYVVEEPSPPLGEGIDVPNAPPELPMPIAGPDRAKRQNWIMRHKLVAATTAVVSAVIVAAAVNSTGGSPGTTTTSQSPGLQRSVNPGSTDVDATVGSAVTIGGVSATVVSTSFQDSVDETHVDGYVVADVAYLNGAQQNKPYNSLDWKIQSPTGAVTGSESLGTDGQLTSGDLAAGGSATGKITFKVGAQKGEFQIIWKPDPVDPARGIWKVPVA